MGSTFLTQSPNGTGKPHQKDIALFASFILKSGLLESKVYKFLFDFTTPPHTICAKVEVSSYQYDVQCAPNYM